LARLKSCPDTKPKKFHRKSGGAQWRDLRFSSS
jgi:hypothetical protein